MAYWKTGNGEAWRSGQGDSYDPEHAQAPEEGSKGDMVPADEEEPMTETILCPDCEQPMVFSGSGRIQGQWWSCANPDCKRLTPILVFPEDYEEEEEEEE